MSEKKEFTISRRLQLTIIFITLIIAKFAGLNSIIDELITLVLGAILALEGVKVAKARLG